MIVFSYDDDKMYLEFRGILCIFCESKMLFQQKKEVVLLLCQAALLIDF